MFKCLLLRNYKYDQSQTVHECSLDGPLQNLRFCSDMKFKMAATAGLSLTLDPMGKMFQNASSLKPLGQLKPNCPGMIIGRSSVFYADRKSKMAATTGHSIIDANHYDFSVIVTNFGPKLRCYGQLSTCYGFPIIAGPEPFPI